MSKTWAQHGRRRRDFCARIKARDQAQPGYTCPRCGQPIDWALTWPHPYSASVDHAHERQDGGATFDPDNAWTMHLVCNTTKGSQRRAQRMRDNTTNGVVITEIGSV